MCVGGWGGGGVGGRYLCTYYRTVFEHFIHFVLNMAIFSYCLRRLDTFCRFSAIHVDKGNNFWTPCLFSCMSNS